MKQLPLYLFVFMAGCISTGPANLITFNEEEDLVEVYEFPTLTKDQLFLKANSWMVEVFSNAESVIQHADKEDGAIIGRYLMDGSLTVTQYGNIDSRVYAVIDIRVRDGKAKIEIKPQREWHHGGWTGAYNYSKDDAIKDMVQLSDNFESYLSKNEVEF
jgi:hypothetical protein